MDACEKLTIIDKIAIFWTQLTITDRIELFAALVTLFVGLVSIIISVRTLRQNRKMIEGETRPYLQVYGATTNFGTKPRFYIVLKNFGKSGAVIEQFNCGPAASQQYCNVPLFQHIAGAMIAPGQSFAAPIDVEHECDIKFNISIRYKSGAKSYNEQYVLHVKPYLEIQSIREPKNDCLATISNVMQDVAIRQL